MKINLLLIFLVTFRLSAALAMDCSKAKYLSEKTACKNPELKAMDQKLNDLYNSKLKQMTEKTPGQKEILKTNQLQWIVQKDKACQDSIECLKMAYSNRLQAIEKYGVEYEKPVIFLVNKFKSPKGIKVTRDIEYVEFFGSDFELARKINHYLSIDKAERESICENESGDVFYSFEVVKLTDILLYLKTSHDISCEGTAHPSSGSSYYTFDLKKGMGVDFWSGLPTSSKKKYIKGLIAAGKKEYKNGDSCLSSYAEKFADEFGVLDIRFEKGKVLLTPQSPRSAMACAIDYTVNADEFANAYKDQSFAKLVMQLTE